MKKSMIFGFVAILFAMTITSCGGDESEDPQPSKPAYVGYWEFMSGTIVDQSDNVTTHTSLSCSGSSDFPLFNYEFDVKDNKTATLKSPCFSDVSLTYNTTIVDGELTAISFIDSGSPSHSFNNVVVNETNKTITLNRVNGLKEAKSISVTFKLK